MTYLSHYLNDGANEQAQATLCFLRDFKIEKSWNKERSRYDAQIYVSRWENCREQGYVLILRNKDFKQLNIAFFEHRNSDQICAIKWQQNTTNEPTISNAEFGEIYKDKYDVSHVVEYGKVVEMADWIKKELENFWTN